MKRAILCGIAVAWLAAGYLETTGQPQLPNPAPSHASQYRSVLDSYCVTCHNGNLRTADLLLDQASVEKIGEGAELWEKVLRKLRTRAMPPAGMPRPDEATYDSFAAYLEEELDRAAAARLDPGRQLIHRLNRAEYANAIRDLLAVDFDAQSYLPPDHSSDGFDNLAAVLTVSPVLMERYMSAARKIGRLAIGDASARVSSEEYHISKDVAQDSRLSEDLPFGSRGGIAIRHHFPLDGEYVLKIRLQRDRTNFIRGLLGEPHQLDVFVDGVRLESFPVGGERHGATGLLHTRTGNIYMGEPEQNDYELSGAEEGLQVRFEAQAGTRLVGVAFLKKTLESEGLLEVGGRPMEPDIDEYKGGDPNIDSVTITGPYQATAVGDTPSRRKIFECRPTNSQDEESCAEKILSTLARRAYRRPVTDADVQPLLGLYRAGRNEGGFEAGIELALQRILAGPEFLFRMERDPENVPPDTAYPVSDLELASRLSFFLWSSIPDDPLLDLAEAGRLKDPAVLEEQVRRMLADYRSSALVDNFAGQWLYLRNLRSWKPSLREFPDFDGELRQALQQETELFFKSMLREDRSVLDLLSADYTFLNERLARHYGIPDVYGSSFRRVTLSDGNRNGLLGQGSILTVTSRVNRTSPVLRGKWVLENLLGTPPLPPPADIPPLNEKRGEVGGLTMRQRMQEHQSNPVCASCHAGMDPIGFALENFDAVGKWRATEGKTPIDASGTLPDGTRFEGPAGLRKVLLSRPQQFVQTATEKLYTYALGRELEYSDAAALRKILREAAPGGYRWSSLILGIIKSTPFQMRRSPS
jgi:mono/diheme cytochrome c family protein